MEVSSFHVFEDFLASVRSPLVFDGKLAIKVLLLIGHIKIRAPGFPNFWGLTFVGFTFSEKCKPHECQPLEIGETRGSNFNVTYQQMHLYGDHLRM